MRALFAVFLICFGCSAAAFADGSQEEHVQRVIQHLTVTEGSVVDWPDCVEGERPGIIVQPLYYVGNMRITHVDNDVGGGTWTFHITAFYEDGKQVQGDALKQIQFQAYTYCEKRKD